MNITVPRNVLNLGHIAPRDHDPFQIPGIAFHHGRAVTSNGHWVIDVTWTIKDSAPDPDMRVIVSADDAKLALRSAPKRAKYVTIKDTVIDTGLAKIACTPVDGRVPGYVSWIDAQGDYSKPKVSEITINPFYLMSITKTLAQVTGVTRKDHQAVRINLHDKTHSVRLRVEANGIVATAYIMPMVID